jgi:hypothetical protein
MNKVGFKLMSFYFRVLTDLYFIHWFSASYEGE